MVTSLLRGRRADFLKFNRKLFSQGIHKRENALKCVRGAHCPMGSGIRTDFRIWLPWFQAPSTPVIILRAEVISLTIHRALRSEITFPHINYSQPPEAHAVSLRDWQIYGQV